LQWPPILDFQQPAEAPTREIRNSIKVLLPKVQC
jgi:hypothetical protein